jgi:hypothetical protein
MRLKEYLEKNDIKPNTLAVKCDICVASIYNYLKGGRPNQVVAERIEKETAGEVTSAELRRKDARR